MALQYRLMVTLALTLLVSLAATRTADGEVPTVADFAACNDEAPEAIKAGTASPIMGDHARADSARAGSITMRSEEHTSELQSQSNLVCRLLLEKKKTNLTVLFHRDPCLLQNV